MANEGWTGEARGGRRRYYFQTFTKGEALSTKGFNLCRDKIDVM